MWETDRGPTMANIEDTSRRLVLKEGSTTLTLDKGSGKATLQQRILLWNKKPVEFAISDIDDIAVKSDVDGMSGATIHHSVLHRRSGEITVLTTEEAKAAAETVKKLRGFIGL
jgi:phosphatidate phosphatase PAH1